MGGLGVGEKMGGGGGKGGGGRRGGGKEGEGFHGVQSFRMLRNSQREFFFGDNRL